MEWFINRLNIWQVKKFLNQFGIKGTRFYFEKQEYDYIREVVVENEKGYLMSFWIKDDCICEEPKISDITSEDWKIYMRQLFGDEYVKAYNNFDLHVDFVTALTVDEIKHLFNMKRWQIAEFYEVEPFIKGTRRIKVRFSNRRYFEEFVIAPHISLCSSNFLNYSNEANLIRVFYQRYQKEFEDFYLQTDRELFNRKLEEFELEYLKATEKKVQLFDGIAKGRYVQ